MQVDLNEKGTELRTSIWYGVYRTGKTRFSATFPRVAWLGSAREGGVETIRNMPASALYEPNRKPLAFTVESPTEVMQHLQRDVMPRVLQGEVKTIVLELSFYADDMIRARAAEETWAKYADLEAHIMHLDAAWKRIPGLRICYNALAASEDDATKPSGILVTGRAVARKLPALCDVVGYIQTDGNDRIFHLAPFGKFPAGHRYGDKLPSKVLNPTYRDFEDLLSGAKVTDAEGKVIPRVVSK